MKLLRVIIFLTVVFLSMLPLMNVNADEERAGVIANISVPLLVGGTEIDGVAQSVPIGSTVCVGTSNKYTRTDERYRFSRWEHSTIRDPDSNAEEGLAETSKSLSNECFVATEGGTYTAIYVQELLFQVRSGVAAYKQSRWVERDTIVDLVVPEIVGLNENVRYRFNGWNAGESPFSIENRIAILVPTVLELGWVTEYNVKVENPDGQLSQSSGWYRSNETLILRTPEEILEDDGRKKLTFQKWDVVYGPLLKN